MFKSCITEPPCVPTLSNTSCAKAQDVPSSSPATEQIEVQGLTSNTTPIAVPSVVEDKIITTTTSSHFCDGTPFCECKICFPGYSQEEAEVEWLDYKHLMENFDKITTTSIVVPSFVEEKIITTITPQSDSDEYSCPSDVSEAYYYNDRPDSAWHQRNEALRLQARLDGLNMPIPPTTPPANQDPFGNSIDPTGISSFIGEHSSLFNFARLSIIVLDYVRVKKKDKDGLRSMAFVASVVGCLKLDDFAKSVRFMAEIKSYFDISIIKPESKITDHMEALFAGGSKVIKKHLPVILKKILALVASVSIMPKLLSSTSGSLPNVIGHLMKKKATAKFTVVSDVMDFLVKLVNDAIDWVCNTRTPSHIAAVLEESKRLRTVQLEFAHTMTDTQRARWMKDCPGVMLKLRELYGKCFADEEYALVGLIDRERELLVKSNVAVSDTKFQHNHLTLAMNFCGNSSIGKSLITDAVSDVVAMYYQGVPFDTSQKFIAGDTKHWDALNNGTKLIIVDDLDADKLAGESRSDRGINGSLCSLLINLVNYIPFTPAMACAEQKGKVTPNPYALIMSSNENNKFGDIAQMGDPTAGARRMIYVDVKLRDKFRSKTTGGFDPKLAGDFYADSPWLFTIMRYDIQEAVTANETKKDPLFYTHLYKVDSVTQTIDPSILDLPVDQWGLTDEEVITVSDAPRQDGLHTYTKKCKDVPISVLRDWIVEEFDSYKGRSDVVDKAKDKTLSNSKDYFANRDARISVVPQSRGKFDFYEHSDAASVWPMWVFCGKVLATDNDVVVESTAYSTLGWFQWFYRWVTICCRLCYFPVLLLAARCIGNAPSGVIVNLQVFYITCFINMCLMTSALGSSQSPVLELFRLIITTVFTPYISKLWGSGSASCFGLFPSSSHLVRRATCARLAVMQRHKTASRLIVGGIFAGTSFLAIKKAIGFYNGLSDINKMAYFPQSGEKDDESPPEASHAEVPPVPSAPVNAGVVKGSPSNTNSLLRARVGVPYTGKYNGNPNDTTRPGLAFQDNPCMSFPEVLGLVQNNMVKLVVQAVDSGALATALPIGKPSHQFGTILGQTSTSAVILLNNHPFAPEANYFKVSVYWKEGQRVRPVIIPRAFIAFGSELPPSHFGGMSGALDIALIGVQDMGAVRDITGLFTKQPAFGNTDMTNVKRISCPSMVGDHCHQDQLELLSGTYHGIKTVCYSIGNMPETTFLGACVEGVGSNGMCGLPYISGRSVVGIHQGAQAPFVYAAPITQGVITTLWDSLQQKAIPGCVNAHVVIGTPLLADPGVSSTPPIVTMTDTVSLHADSVVRTIAPNAKYSVVGNSGSGGIAFHSSYRKSPLKGHLYGAIPALKEVGRAHSTPNPDIHLSHAKMFDKTGPATKVEPFSLRVAYKDVKTDMESNFIKLAVGDRSYITQLGPCGMDDALAGYGCTLAGSVALTTSAGTLKGKKDAYFDRSFDEGLGRYVTCLKEDGPMTTYITDTVDGMVTRAQRGITSTLSRKVVPKDEPREHERDSNGSIVSKAARLIHAGELVELIVFRMYFLPIMAVLGMDPGGFGHAVGLNPAESWGDLHKRFSRLEDTENFATDYSSFDLTISVHLMDAAVNLLISLTHMMSGYTDEHRRIMRVICYDLCNPIYDVDGTWVRFTGSNSSGNPLTTMLNCLVNHLVWNQVWVMWSHDRMNPAQSGLYHLVSNDNPALSTVMSLTCLGDDFFGAVTRSSGFTQIDAVNYAAKLGFTLTGADKGAEITPYASSISFLKRRMIVYQTNRGELVLAPLSMTSLLRPFIWGEWKVDIIEHYAGLIKGMLVELVQHGPEVYEEYVTLFRDFTSEFHLMHSTSPRRASIKETLSSYFSVHDFRSWEDRITEMYGNGEQIYVQAESARMV